MDGKLKDQVNEKLLEVMQKQLNSKNIEFSIDYGSKKGIMCDHFF